MRASLRVVTNNEGINGLFYRNSGRWEELQVPASRVSKAFDYSGPAVVTFYPHPFTENDPVPTPLAVGELKEGLSEQILAFVPSSSVENRFHVLAIDGSKDYFLDQHLLFYNVSGKPVMGSFNTRVIRVESGQVTLRPYSESDGRAFRIQLAVPLENGEWKRVYASGVAIMPKRRWLVLFLPDTIDPWLLSIQG